MVDGNTHMYSSTLELNRAKHIVGDNIPYCILLEITSHGGFAVDQDLLRSNPLYRRKVLTVMSNAKYPVLNLDKGTLPRSSDWVTAAKFVNPNVELEWSRSQLLQALKFIHYVMNVEDFSVLSQCSKGAITPTCPESIDLLLVYTILCKWGITVPVTVDKSQILQLFTLIQRPIRLTGDSIYARIAYYRVLLEQYGINEVLEYNPIPFLDKETAILQAAVQYDLNISMTEDPVTLYTQLTNEYGEGDHSNKRDRFHQLLTTAPLSVKVSVTFDPELPQGAYSMEKLRRLCELSGLENSGTQDDLYQQLYEEYLISTYHYGLMGVVGYGLKSYESPLSLEDGRDCPTDVLCYGSRADGNMTVVLISDIIDMLVKTNYITHPLETNTLMEDHHIRKLKAICTIDPITENKRRLLTELERVQTLQSTMDKYELQMLAMHNGGTEKERLYIKYLLDALLHMSMYCRGWAGPPNKYELVGVRRPDQATVDINVTESIRVFEEGCNKKSHIGNIIMNLPLMIYKEGGYVRSFDEYEGLTIGDRFNIMKKGETVTTSASCIRLTSNWLASSAHKYITMLKYPEPFDVRYLSHIA